MDKLLERIQAHPSYRGQIIHIENLPSREPEFGDLDRSLHPLHPLIEAGLRRRGIERLFTHQVDAIEKVRRGGNIVVVTPTASGKSMCYNLPVLESLLMQPVQTALYLFPTKSLGQDQLDALNEFGLDLMGGLHAVEHAAIGLLPLFAMCDRNDLGGLSTVVHPQTQGSTIFIHDACHGGVGFSEKGYDEAAGLFEATLNAVTSCECRDGCPACIYSPKCSNFNRPLDKEAAVFLLHLLLGKPYGIHNIYLNY